MSNPTAPLLVVIEEGYGRSRKYHFRNEIAAITTLYVQRYDNWEDRLATSPLALALVRLLFTFEGIETMSLSPLVIDITRGAAFSWAELDGQILDAIRTAHNIGQIDLRRLDKNELVPVEDHLKQQLELEAGFSAPPAQRP